MRDNKSSNTSKHHCGASAQDQISCTGNRNVRTTLQRRDTSNSRETSVKKWRKKKPGAKFKAKILSWPPAVLMWCSSENLLHSFGLFCFLFSAGGLNVWQALITVFGSRVHSHTRLLLITTHSRYESFQKAPRQKPFQSRCVKLTLVLSGSRFSVSPGLAPASLAARAVCSTFQRLHHTSPCVTQPIRSTSCLRQPRRPLALQGKGIWELLPSHILRCFCAKETHSDAWRSRKAEALFSKQMNTYATAGRCFLYERVMGNKEQSSGCVSVSLVTAPYTDSRGVESNGRVYSSSLSRT